MSSEPFEEYKPEKFEPSLRKLLEMFPFIYMDYDYNRHGGPNGKSGWSDANCAEYAGAFIKGRVGNPIYIYPLEDNLTALMKALDSQNPKLMERYTREEIDRTIKYCTDLIDKGYKWCHAEGYNSLSTMYCWVMEGLKKPAFSKRDNTYIQPPPLVMEKDKEGKYVLALGADGIPQYDRDKYTELLNQGKAPMTEEVWHKTLSRKLNVTAFTEMSLGDLKYEIGVLNQRTSWNKAELRNSYDTELAAFVRREDEEWKIVFQKLHKSEGVKYDTFFQKRDGQEMISRLISLWWPNKEYKLGTGAVALEKLYNEELDVPKELREKIARIRKQLEFATRNIDPLVLNISLFVTLAICLEIIDSLGYKLNNKTKECFIEWFTKKDFLLAKRASKRKAPKGMSQKEIQQEDYQYWKKNKDNKVYSEKIHQLWTAFLLTDEVGMQYLLDNKVVKRKRTSDLEFKEKQKLKAELHFAQNGKDRNGKELPWLDIYRPGKQEVDHILSVTDGGLAVIENAELVTREDNRKKGAKSLEPFFEHSREPAQQNLFE